MEAPTAGALGAVEEEASVNLLRWRLLRKCLLWMQELLRRRQLLLLAVQHRLRRRGFASAPVLGGWSARRLGDS